ncbi:DUF3616 domain-containing protein [Methylobacterium oxalidis]|uniref:DUF3616 domain-containing protein n=1 Tax=Methylobacterium oxalidis TaxID=944322 RepID=A0A512J2Z7_9HYPH|nr:DUF3616 domain-containing protein [Methylobacterium oxalidis]GEP04310.1 hypothetical protein MOX02_23480 [Methylobacterium oxalidis]GJE30620.1 hypothetical protein LDDCCGHA_0789 [Methylobacterium oxalidis]GLS67171.1 hypothetical protein GCM10007888_55540 [Methylobacterium oxalidis]
MTLRPTFAPALALLACLAPLPAGAEPPAYTGTEFAAKGFRTDGRDGLEPALDVSGIACLPPDGQGRRSCLVVNDQDTYAQLATLDAERLQGGDLVFLIDREHRREIRGRKPKRLGCSKGKGGFKDLDGEGVAYAAPYYYVVGSHGCARRDRNAVRSAFLLARLRVDPDGVPPSNDFGSVETTWRLNEILRRDPVVGPHYGRDLDEAQDGLNIEGVAAIGDRLFFGLRAPSIGGRAFVLAVRADDLFAPEGRGSAPAGERIELDLGEGVGIRDLAALDDGRLLVLSGPTRRQAGIPFRVHAAEARPGGRLEFLTALQDVPAGRDERAKAEGILPLDGQARRFLVLFDGLRSGGPWIYERR